MPDIELLLELSHLYNISINQLLEDFDLIFSLTCAGSVHSSIHYFVPKEERDYNKQWFNEIKQGKWIKNNWQRIKENLSFNDSVGEKIAKQGGIILEIGAGPGGGFMPHILKADIDATIIISDLSPTVVSEWKDFLDKELNSPNLYYAAMDFCNIPFPSNSIDIVSDGGGIGNAEGDKKKALKEVYRILKPGGMLVTSTGFVNKETLASLPKNIQKELLSRRPDIFEDLYEDTVLAGFQKIDSVICEGGYTENDDSSIADLARSLGVNLKFTSYVRYCVK